MNPASASPRAILPGSRYNGFGRTDRSARWRTRSTRFAKRLCGGNIDGRRLRLRNTTSAYNSTKTISSCEDCGVVTRAGIIAGFCDRVFSRNKFRFGRRVQRGTPLVAESQKHDSSLVFVSPTGDLLPGLPSPLRRRRNSINDRRKGRSPSLVPTTRAARCELADGSVPPRFRGGGNVVIWNATDRR